MLKLRTQEYEDYNGITFNGASSDESLLEELTYLESLERCMFDLASEKEMNQLTVIRTETRYKAL